MWRADVKSPAPGEPDTGPSISTAAAADAELPLERLRAERAGRARAGLHDQAQRIGAARGDRDDREVVVLDVRIDQLAARIRDIGIEIAAIGVAHADDA